MGAGHPIFSASFVSPGSEFRVRLCANSERRFRLIPAKYRTVTTGAVNTQMIENKAMAATEAKLEGMWEVPIDAHINRVRLAALTARSPVIHEYVV